MRHKGPDGTVLVRTYPLTFLHDHVERAHTHDWDQLTYAASGVMRVDTDAASWLVPPHRAGGFRPARGTRNTCTVRSQCARCTLSRRS
jgi:hypothetical protein